MRERVCVADERIEKKWKKEKKRNAIKKCKRGEREGGEGM